VIPIFWGTMNSTNNVLLGYDDVTLIPQYSEIISRSDPSTTLKIGNFKLSTPIIAANMDTITESEMAIKMWQIGAVAGLHRFMSVDQNVLEYKKVRAASAECFVTIGAKDYKERATALYDAGARNFIIDIAHGHSLLMKNVLMFLRPFKDVLIMAGNVATAEATKDLLNWGADIIKVGVSAGSICKTRVVTGHGVPMFSAVLECANEAANHKTPNWVIADGGIKAAGDIVKALVAGADGVMLGSLLAGTNETPGRIVEVVAEYPVYSVSRKKEYRGMASNEAQKNLTTKTENLSPASEGVSTYVDLKGSVESVINELTMGLKSGMSYCNATSLNQIQVRAKWKQQTMSGYYEGTPHILSR